MKAKNTLFGVLAFLFLVFSSCKKDKNDYPSIQTVEVSAISPVKALLKGNITELGSFDITDYGFVYGTDPNLTETNGKKASLGDSPGSGSFSKEVQLTLSSSYNRMIYARAYITNSKGTVFGQVMSKELPSPSASGINPTSGRAGDKISISGQFYTSDKSEVEVLFGSIKATISEVSPTKIVAEVPSGILNGSNGNQISLLVKVGGQQVGYSYTFNVLPTFTDFSPKTGFIGSAITISADNLYGYYGYYSNVRVFVGQTETSIYSQTSNSIVVIVPSTITSAKTTVSVSVNGVVTVLPGELTINPPTISSISPVSTLPGGNFSIFGNNFPYNGYSSSSGIKVFLGDVPISASVSSPGQISANVPNDFPAGDYKVSLEVGPNRVEASQRLKVQALTITGFSPASGPSGKEVTLSGTFLPGYSYAVYFGTAVSYASSSTATSLKVAVPGTEAGKVKISVRQGNLNTVAEGDFTVTGPTITSFSPSSGVAGTVVTINGTGFSPYSYYNTVKFGSISANVLSGTETTLRVSVPSNISPSSMKLTVINGFNQTVVSTDNFTITN